MENNSSEILKDKILHLLEFNKPVKNISKVQNNTKELYSWSENVFNTIVKKKEAQRKRFFFKNVKLRECVCVIPNVKS